MKFIAIQIFSRHIKHAHWIKYLAFILNVLQSFQTPIKLFPPNFNLVQTFWICLKALSVDTFAI